MFRSLYARLALVLAGLFLAVVCLFVVLVGFSAGMYRQELDQRLGRDLAENILAEHRVYREGGVDQAALEALFHTFMVVNPRIEVYLVAPDGEIQAFSAPPGVVKMKQVDMVPLKAFLSGEGMYPILGDDPRRPGRRNIFSVAPIRAMGHTHGFLYVVLGGERYDGILRHLEGSFVARLSAWALAAGVLFALAAGLLLFYVLTRRLRGLAAEMEAFKRSGFTEVPAPVPATAGCGDEVARLAATYHEMAERIVDQVARLRQVDALRRELVANVSHDLRTPLASLQGYLETLLLKEDDLDAEERRRYLTVAARHGERLSRLVAELFELARLDSDEARPDCEPFSLPELVQDVVQKHKLGAEEQGIRLDARLGAEPPFVDADIGMIERVLENLIQNALQYTPAGGEVTVDLVSGDGVVTVRVRDTGRGIAEADLPHVFERFYRADKDRGSAVNAGLGLAIARRILELHGSGIAVESRPGEGAVFSFDLPMASS